MTNPNLTEIVCILDRSGSMESLRADAIEGVNAFIAQQQKLPGEARLTVVLFDHEYILFLDGIPLNEAPLFDSATYVPRGTTALLDAVGRTIDDVGKRLSQTPEERRPGKVIVAILTDGLENASTDYTYERVAQMIQHQREKYNWEFIFLAANQDAIASAARISIEAQATVSFTASPAGVREAYTELGERVAEARRRPRKGA